MIDQAAELRMLMKEYKDNNAKIITIASGKGGVGKSNFIVNLALCLQKKNNKVLILDTDIGMGNIDILMGLYPKYNILDIIKGDFKIEDVIIEGPLGISLLPAGNGLNIIEELKEKERQKFLNKIKKLDKYDYIIIDTSAGINKSLLAFIAASQELLLIITPEPTSLTDSYSLLKTISYFDLSNNIKVVINRVNEKEEAEKTFNKIEKASNKFLKIAPKYLGYISEDINLRKSIKEQQPIVLKYPESQCAICINNIAEEIILCKKETSNKENEIGATGLFGKIFSFFQNK